MSSKFDLWKLLNEYRVIIPIIQRDYAQGRKENDYIRKTFLKDIKNCLCSEQTKQLTLDFIYGNIECKNCDDKRFYPLDGQQRLTTLWLVYWYVSFKAGKLSEDGERLKKFTYETRRSSRDFCMALCDKVDSAKGVNDNESIVDYIKSQTWFYSAWLQDPTINAMLRTLGGEGDNNIEKIFKQCDFNNLRLQLIKADSNPIQFELMIIGGDKLPISDDLYIKMNARGKPLTNFENFKADLVAWIQDPQNGDRKNFDRVKDTKSSLSYSQHFPIQIDNAWTDVFWDYDYANKREKFDGKIDDQYFAFINRFVVNKICFESELKPDEFDQKKDIMSLSDDKKRDRIAFDKLIGVRLEGSDANDGLVKYEGGEIYKGYLNFDALNNLDKIFNLLNQKDIVKKINEELNITNTDDGKTYSFIPVYDDEKHALVPTSRKERVYFFAICKFLLKNESGYLDVDFERWMRVVKNLTENAAIDNVSAMITCMRLIGGKQLDVNDVYTSLCKINVFPDSQLGRQLKEEKEKAKKIKDEPALENKIITAEQYAFFNGSIRFLYRNGCKEDWDNFDTRFKKAKGLFSDSLNEVRKNTIKNLLGYFSNFEDIKEKHLFTSIGYHSRHACWKRDILCSEDKNLLDKVNSLLMGAKVPEKKSDPNKSDPNYDYNKFLENGMVEKIVEQTENYKYRYHWYYNDYAIHKEYSQTEGVYVSEQRLGKNKVLLDNKDIKVDQSNFEQEGYIWGVKIKFKYQGIDYTWDGANNIRRADKGVESENSEKWECDRDLISCLNELNRPENGT